MVFYNFCCCNLSTGVALNARFTTNGMCAKNNTTYLQNRRQKVLNRGFFSSAAGLCVCAGVLDIIKLTKIPLIYSVSLSIWGVLEICLGGLSPPKPPWRRDCIYVARTSNNKMISSGELYCCLLPQCEALPTCRSGFLIATKWCCDQDVKVVPCEAFKNVRSVQFVVNNKGMLLQPLRWRCAECAVHHERNGREEQHHMHVARTSNNRVISSGELYRCLLPQYEALRTCRSSFPIVTLPLFLRSTLLLPKNKHNW